MTLRLTDSVTAEITAQNIVHRPNVMQYAHHYVCTNIVALRGIQAGVSLHRHGTVQAICPVQSVNNGTEIRITWTNQNTVCNVYINTD